MAEVAFEYKCRRCGAVAEGFIGGETRMRQEFEGIVEAAQNGHEPRDVSSFPVIAVCECEDGGTGIADLIGLTQPR